MFLEVQTQAFFPGGFPADQRHCGFAEIALFCQKRDQVCVGLAIHRGGGNPDFEGISIDPADFVQTGAGLDMDIDQQVITLPVIPAGHA